MDMKPEMMGEEQGETAQCVHIYMKADGSAMVSQSEGPIPEDAQPAASLDEAFEMARDMAENPIDQEEEDAVASAQIGYKRKAQTGMSAPNPEALFGE